MVEIVVGEAQERCSAATLIESTNPTAAEQLRAEAEMLLALVGIARDGGL